MKIFFSIVIASGLIFLARLSWERFKLSQLKKKIIKSPLVGNKDREGNYSYGEGGLTLSYRLKEQSSGARTIVWLFSKRRLTPLEERLLRAKRYVNEFFLYKRWLVFLWPPVAIVLLVSLIVLYSGLTGYRHDNEKRLAWIAAKVSGVSPESIEYGSGGWFKVMAKRRSANRMPQPVTISFNPLLWFFFPDSANVNIWRSKSSSYVKYRLTFNDKGDVWLGGRSDRVHGTVSGDRIVWDEQRTTGSPGHRITVKDGELNILDE